MHYLSLDVRQTDCPLTRVTRTHEVRFTTPYWHFDSKSGHWRLRIHAAASDRRDLGAALNELRDADSVNHFDLQWKGTTSAFVKTKFAETTAIGTVNRHGGYVIGPFQNIAGIERWHLGFDTPAAVDATIADLDRQETFNISDRGRVGPLHESTASAGVGWCESHPQLTDRQAEVLETALEQGYYETPRTTTLTALGDELDVSDVAVSKTLRRVERKLLTDAVDRLDESP